MNLWHAKRSNFLSGLKSLNLNQDIDLSNLYARKFVIKDSQITNNQKKIQNLKLLSVSQAEESTIFIMLEKSFSISQTNQTPQKKSKRRSDLVFDNNEQSTPTKRQVFDEGEFKMETPTSFRKKRRELDDSHLLQSCIKKKNQYQRHLGSHSVDGSIQSLSSIQDVPEFVIQDDQRSERKGGMQMNGLNALFAQIAMEFENSNQKKRSKSSISTHSSGSNHEVWDNDPLDQRGIDTENWVDLKQLFRSEFTLFHLYKARSGQYDGMGISNEQVIDMMNRFAKNKQPTHSYPWNSFRDNLSYTNLEADSVIEPLCRLFIKKNLNKKQSSTQVTTDCLSSQENLKPKIEKSTPQIIERIVQSEQKCASNFQKDKPNRINTDPFDKLDLEDFHAMTNCSEETNRISSGKQNSEILANVMVQAFQFGRAHQQKVHTAYGLDKIKQTCQNHLTKQISSMEKKQQFKDLLNNFHPKPKVFTPERQMQISEYLKKRDIQKIKISQCSQKVSTSGEKKDFKAINFDQFAHKQIIKQAESQKEAYPPKSTTLYDSCQRKAQSKVGSNQKSSEKGIPLQTPNKQNQISHNSPLRKTAVKLTSQVINSNLQNTKKKIEVKSKQTQSERTNYLISKEIDSTHKLVKSVASKLPSQFKTPVTMKLTYQKFQNENKTTQGKQTIKSNSPQQLKGTKAPPKTPLMKRSAYDKHGNMSSNIQDKKSSLALSCRKDFLKYFSLNYEEQLKKRKYATNSCEKMPRLPQSHQISITPQPIKKKTSDKREMSATVKRHKEPEVNKIHPNNSCPNTVLSNEKARIQDSQKAKGNLKSSRCLFSWQDANIVTSEFIIDDNLCNEVQKNNYLNEQTKKINETFNPESNLNCLLMPLEYRDNSENKESAVNVEFTDIMKRLNDSQTILINMCQNRGTQQQNISKSTQFQPYFESNNSEQGKKIKNRLQVFKSFKNSQISKPYLIV